MVQWEHIWKTETGDKIKMDLHEVNCSEVLQWWIFC
jgi:hypothetical protein